jgi:hypothetical protein
VVAVELPIQDCGYRVVLPWWLVGHTVAAYLGWTAERMRVVCQLTVA